MLEKLTKNQVTLQAKKRDEWVNIALHNKNFDKEELEAGVKWLYYASNLKEPKVVFVDGPKDFTEKLVPKSVLKKLLSSVGASVGDSVRDSVGASVWASVRDSVWASVRDSVRASVRDSVGASVRDSVGASVGDSVGASVGDSVWASVRDSVWASVRDSVRASVSWCSLACDAEFGAWYEYYKEIKAIPSQEKADKYVGYLKAGAFYAMFFEKKAFIMCRPVKVEQDERKRLHCITGPALVFADGTEIYQIHGVRFTKEQFEKSKTATVSEILSWEDIDQRSVLLRERPIDTLLAEVPKKLIDHSDECGGYDLWELELKNIGKTKILSYHGWSSEKPYAKFVPLDSTNALDTVAKLRHQTTQELINSFKS